MIRSVDDLWVILRFQGRTQGVEQKRRLNGLGEKAVATRGQSPCTVLGKGVRRGGDDGDAAPPLLASQLCGELQAVLAALQRKIHENGCDAAAVLRQLFTYILAAGRFSNQIAF